LLGLLLFDDEYGGSAFLRNFGKVLNYTASHLRTYITPNGLRMFDNRKLRRMFVPVHKEDAVTGACGMVRSCLVMYSSTETDLLIKSRFEVGEACSTHRRNEKCVQRFRWKTRRAVISTDG
jgi:hypothetical protein